MAMTLNTVLGVVSTVAVISLVTPVFLVAFVFLTVPFGFIQVSTLFFSTSNPSFLLSQFYQQSSHRSQKKWGDGGFLKIGKKSGNLNCFNESGGRGHCRHE